MKIKKDTAVGITFELKVSKDEEGIESAPFSVEVRGPEDPFYFVFGNSGLPEKFEIALLGKNKGEKLSLKIGVEDAYGQADEDLVMAVSKDEFTPERGFGYELDPEMLTEGNFLPLSDENGYPLQAKVLKDLGDEVLLDFNHPLVGFDLHFEVEIADVREATAEEIAQGHIPEENN